MSPCSEISKGKSKARRPRSFSLVATGLTNRWHQELLVRVILTHRSLSHPIENNINLYITEEHTRLE